MTPVSASPAITAPTSFAALSDDLMSQIGVRMAFAKDEEIYGQGEEADLIYRVVSGAVRTNRFMIDGRRPIDAFYYAGDIFGLEQGDTHAHAAEALSDCVVLVANRRALHAVDRGSALAELVWSTTLRELDRTREHLALLVRTSAAERVASFLLRTADRAPGPAVELAMSRQDIADYLGLTIETVSRMVTHLQACGAVVFEAGRRFVIRDRNALQAIAAT